jgi:hypothetical protein
MQGEKKTQTTQSQQLIEKNSGVQDYDGFNGSYTQLLMGYSDCQDFHS